MSSSLDIRNERLTLVTVIVSSQLLLQHSAFGRNVVLELSPYDQQTITTELGSGVVGKALPSKAIDDVSIYFPLQEKVSVYQVMGGPNVGKTQTLDFARARRPSGKSAWRFQLSPSLAGLIHQVANGDLMMSAVSDAGEGVVVITTPANPFILKGIGPGESRSFVQRVQVNALEDPTDKEYSGSLHGTFSYLCTYEITVPAGSYEADLFRLKWEGKVGPANTRDTAYYFFAPGKGVVAMISQENATGFWLIHIDIGSGKILKE